MPKRWAHPAVVMAPAAAGSAICQAPAHPARNPAAGITVVVAVQLAQDTDLSLLSAVAEATPIRRWVDDGGTPTVVIAATDGQRWLRLHDESAACFGPFRATRQATDVADFEVPNGIASPEPRGGPRRE